MCYPTRKLVTLVLDPENTPAYKKHKSPLSREEKELKEAKKKMNTSHYWEEKRKEKVGEHEKLGPIYEQKVPQEQKQITSNKYQWLPAEFGVDKSGKVSVLSYINNLDPSK